MWSPRSTSLFQAASAGSPTRFCEIMTWMSPVPSLIVAKQSLPPMRDSTTRPVTPTFSPVAVSGSRSGTSPGSRRSSWYAGTRPGTGRRRRPVSGQPWPGAPASARAGAHDHRRSPARDYRSRLGSGTGVSCPAGGDGLAEPGNGGLLPEHLPHSLAMPSAAFGHGELAVLLRAVQRVEEGAALAGEVALALGDQGRAGDLLGPAGQRVPGHRAQP